MRRTRITRLIHADRARVYETLLDPSMLPRWKVPDGMTLVVHEYEPRVGGRLRVSLSYDDTSAAGKTSGHTDTYRGRFVRLVPNELIVEEDEFETGDASVAGPMTITLRLSDRAGATEVEATHEPVPEGVSLEDNELGWTMALDKLSALLESA